MSSSSSSQSYSDLPPPTTLLEVHNEDKASTQDYTRVPITLIDATKGNTDLVVQISLSFPERLSFEVLEESWYEFVSAWPILSARIRDCPHSPSGLSYHIPSPARMEEIRKEAHHLVPTKRQFYCLDEGSRPISSYSASLGHGIDSPVQQSRIFTALSPTSEDERRITAGNATMTFNDYLTLDVPLMSIQVTRFAQDTLVSLSVSHVIGDGFCIKDILKAWENIIHNRGSPAPLEDLGLDPFAAFEPTPESLKKPAPLPLGFQYFGMLEKAQFFKNFLYDLYIGRPEKSMQQRYIFIPRHEVDRLLQVAKRDLESTSSTSTEQTVGKSDVLYAWLMKNSHAGLSRSMLSTPLTIVNARGRLPAGIQKSSLPRHEFWGAALPVPLDGLVTGELQDMSLGELALHVRTSVAKKSGPENARDSINFHIHHSLWKNRNYKNGRFPFFCPSNHRWSGITDWRAIKLLDVDFGPAAIPSTTGEEKRKVRVWGANVQMSADMSKRDRWCSMGESDEGVWFTGYTSQSQWSHLNGFGQYDQYLPGKGLVSPRGQSRL